MKPYLLKEFLGSRSKIGNLVIGKILFEFVKVKLELKIKFQIRS